MATSPPPPKPRRRRRRTVLLLAPPVLFLLYVLFGFFGVPWLVQHTAMDRITDRLNGRASVGHVDFNPFTFEVALDNMLVVNADAKSVAGFGHVYANLQVSSLWHRAWVFSDIVVNEPFCNVDIDKAGELNLHKLIKPLPPGDPKKDKPFTLPAMEITRLTVISAGFDYTDRSLPELFHHRATDITFTLDDFNTRPDNLNPYTFTATTADGEHIAWEGSFYLDPLTSDGRFTFEKIDVPAYFPYYSRFANCRVTGGKLTVRLAYHFAPMRAPKALSVAVESVELRGLVLKADGEKEPFFTLERAALDGIDADAVGRSLGVKKLTVTGGKLIARRLPNGKITLIDWLTPPAHAPASQPSTAPAPSKPGRPSAPGRPGPGLTRATLESTLAAILNDDAHRPWSLKVDSIEISDQQLTAEDRAAARPLNLNINQLALTAGPIRSADHYALPLKLSAQVGEKGRITIDGRLTPPGNVAPTTAPASSPITPSEVSESTHADLHVTITDLDVTPLDAYWGDYVAARLPTGRLSLNGRLTAQLDSIQKFAARFVGQATLNDIALVKLNETEPFASTGELKATGFDADATLTGRDLAYHIGVGELTITKPMVRVVLMRAPAAATQPSTKTNTSGGGGGDKGKAAKKSTVLKTNLDDVMSQPLPLPRGVHIDHVIVKDGLAVLDDQTEPAPAKLTVTAIDADGRGLSRKHDARLDFDIKAKYAGDAPFHIQGHMLSHDPGVDTAFTLTMNYAPLTTFDPYAKRFIGFGIARGKLNTDVTYTVKNNKLVGDNKVHFDALYLGESYDSPDAVDLPFRLAVAMLRDRKDQIELDVPLAGDLNDPKFSLSAIIWQAIGTTLEKIVAAPFDTLASLMGAKDVDLSQVRFDPGTANPSEGEARKFDLLVQALQERPGLVLGLHAMTDPAADAAALRRNHLKTAILLKAKGKHADPNAPPPDPATLKEADYRQAVARLYTQITKNEAAAEEKPKTKGKPFHEIGDFFHSIFGGDKDEEKQGDDAKSKESGKGAPPPVTFETMEATLLATVPLVETELPNLAHERSNAVRRALLPHLEPARLIDDPKAPKDAKPAASVVFDLR